MKIGITEAGDASLDYTWVEKAPEMDMMILITKNVTDKFIREVMRFANKTIVHATCTGYGGTRMEPGVPKWKNQLEQTKKLIAMGFPAEQVVVRIDPIFPTPKGIATIEKIVEFVFHFFFPFFKTKNRLLLKLYRLLYPLNKSRFRLIFSRRFFLLLLF
jgi:DNA repair photolyase